MIVPRVVEWMFVVEPGHGLRGWNMQWRLASTGEVVTIGANETEGITSEDEAIAYVARNLDVEARLVSVEEIGIQVISDISDN